MWTPFGCHRRVLLCTRRLGRGGDFGLGATFRFAFVRVNGSKSAHEAAVSVNVDLWFVLCLRLGVVWNVLLVGQILDSMLRRLLKRSDFIVDTARGRNVAASETSVGDEIARRGCWLLRRRSGSCARDKLTRRDSGMFRRCGVRGWNDAAAEC